MIVADRLRRNRKMTSTTRMTVRSSVNLTSWTDSRIETERSLRIAERERGGQLRLQLRQQRLDRVDDFDGVRARLPLDREVDASGCR